MAISPAQSLAARGLLNLSQVKLARLANVSGSMIRDFEKGRRTPTIGGLKAIRAALEAKGIEFTNGDHPRVRVIRRGKGPPDGVGPSGQTIGRAVIDRRAGLSKEESPWPSTARTASNSSAKSLRNSWLARPFMGSPNATTSAAT